MAFMASVRERQYLDTRKLKKEVFPTKGGGEKTKL
jgi:hypothetical protein